MYNGITKAQVEEQREYSEVNKNNGAVFVKDTNTGHVESYYIGGETCHRPVYNVRDLFKSSNYEAVLLVTRPGRNYPGYNKGSHTKAYIDWLVNRSPWSSIFLLKDANKILNDHFYVETNVPNNLMMGGVIAVRHSWEFGDRIKFWYKLVKAGVDETVAFILIYHFAESNKGIKPQYWGMHNAIRSFSIGKEYYKNFYNHYPVNKESNYSTLKRYSYVDRCWGDCNDTNRNDHWITKAIVSFNSPKESSEPSPTLLRMNPWYYKMKHVQLISKQKDYVFTFDDLVNFGKEFLNLEEMK